MRNGLILLRTTPKPVPPTTHTLIRLAKLALPLGLVMMLGSLATNIPSYVLERYWGEGEVGIFAALFYLMAGSKTVILALGESASPRLAQHFAAGEIRRYTSLLAKLVGIGLVIALGALGVSAVAGEPLLSLLYRPEYGARAEVFVWLTVAIGIGYLATFMGYGMTAARRFQAQLPLFTTAALVTVLACLWLIPRWGAIGGAIALLIASTVQLVGGLAVVIVATRERRRARNQEGEL
jgi:O-antigen/teichoic acid export membrane protein